MAKTIYSQDPRKYIAKLAEALQKIPEFEIPEWALFVKSGTSRERPPTDDDFWYVRAASVLRQLYIKGVVGVGRLRVRYGSRKDRGGRPDQFRKGSGKIIRVILQQAEKAGLVEKMSRLQHGRRLTQSGRDFLDSITVDYDASVNLDDVLVSSFNEVVEQEVGEESSEGAETVTDAVENVVEDVQENIALDTTEETEENSDGDKDKDEEETGDEKKDSKELDKDEEETGDEKEDSKELDKDTEENKEEEKKNG